jgi:hypothetical protein
LRYGMFAQLFSKCNAITGFVITSFFIFNIQLCPTT